MSTPNTTIKSLPSTSLKEEYTSEFILLGLFYFADKYKYEMDIGKTAKILSKFKQQTQKNDKLQAYHKEFYRDFGGEFTKYIYPELEDLQAAGFISTLGDAPREKFVINEAGRMIFEAVVQSKGDDATKITKVALEKVIVEDGKKTFEQLREESHSRFGIFKIHRDENKILVPNLPPKKRKHSFYLTDEQIAEWSIAIGLGRAEKKEHDLDEESVPAEYNSAEAISELFKI